MKSSDYTRITRRGLAQELSSALGEEKAWQCVRSACRDLALDQWVLNREEILLVLTYLRKESGLVGIIARALALKVAVVDPDYADTLPALTITSAQASSLPASSRSNGSPASARRHSAPVSMRVTPQGPAEPLTLRKLTKMLGESIGLPEARSVVAQAAKELAIGENFALTQRQAELLLENLKKHPGLIGVSAHFLSTRLHMLIGR